MAIKTTGLSGELGRVGFILNIIFTVIAVVAVGLRVWAMILIKRSTEAHDFFVFGALIFGLAFSTGYAYCIHPGIVGLHAEEALQVEPSAQEITYKLIFVAGFTWVMATTFVKLSILQLYRMMFQSEQRKYIHGSKFKYANNALQLVVMLFCIGHIIVISLECRPIEKQWNKTLKTGHCTDLFKRELGDAFINMILDLGIVVLPMPVLWMLQMPTRTKLQISATFGLGILICMINIARVAVIATTNQADSTYDLVYIGILAGLEIYLGILAACFPLFRFLVLRRTRLRSDANRPFFSHTKTIGGGKTKKRFGSELSAFTRAQEDTVSLRSLEHQHSSKTSTFDSENDIHIQVSPNDESNSSKGPI